jgi:ribA/ribD-fused uncharacterized protein
MAEPEAKRARREVVLFFHPREAHGWLSNWSAHAVREGELLFPTVEHYFMYHKALLFGDAKSCAAVLAAPLASDAKALGRRVRGFDEARWTAEREVVMRRGLELKVEQHPALRDALAATGDSLIAEASPYDATWGIGCAARDPRAADPDRWRGRNLLGALWMQVRDA